MDIIDEFIAHYVKEYDYYERAAKLARESLEQDLRSAGIRCIVTSRAKAIDRLAEKCRKRNRDGRYETIADITADIVDLAGVRVALYFPAESEQVDKLIENLFEQIEARREFPQDPPLSKNARFCGYSALHYRVRLKAESLPEVDRRYAEARIEIQVASVLMHAWSEVEHDLAYKPMNGELSDDERALLDQLNGLVHTGEIALEALQRAGQRRVENSSRRFSNHFELATFLLKREGIDQAVETALGRVDVLYEFIRRLGFDTPEDLNPYLASLHGNLEERALSEQVVDAILAQHPEHSELYRRILLEARIRSVEVDGDGDADRLFVAYLSEWHELERLLATLAPSNQLQRNIGAVIDGLFREGRIDIDLYRGLDHTRRTRNSLVHGQARADAMELNSEIHRIRRIIATLTAADEPQDG